MKEFKGNLKWILLFLAIIALSLATIFVYKGAKPAAKTAKIIQGGSVVRVVSLENVREPYEFTVTNGSGGENTVRVENGRIAVVHANCPDKICVSRGFINNGMLPIVCLPNKLSVVIVGGGDSEIDAVAGGDAQ